MKRYHRSSNYQRSSWPVTIASLLLHAILICPSSALSTGGSSTTTSTSTTSNSESSFARNISGKLILAPLTRGGNLPYRRLCADLGMEASTSEMIYARSLLKGDPVEQARLRRAPNEQLFGVQIATNNIEEGVAAATLAAESGANFLDLNCGCPIYEATRRGLGSSLLRSPEKLARLVTGLVRGSPIPVTVKIRTGCEVETINVGEIVERLCGVGGVGAVTVHGRVAQQGYSRAADWDLIQTAVDVTRDYNGGGEVPVVVGNGDILTHYEARRRMEETSVDSIMVGRGALIKPWIFQEFQTGQTWLPTANDRIAVYRTLACYMKDHFGDDELGRTKAWNFLPWHFEFLSRYLPLPHAEYGDLSVEGPLIQNRALALECDSPLDTLLSHRSNDAHSMIATALWESMSDADAVAKLVALSESHEFQMIQMAAAAAATSSSREDEELTNLPKGKAGRWEKRRGRNPPPKRTEEEIAAIRKERAEKKAAILAAGGTWPPP